MELVSLTKQQAQDQISRFKAAHPKGAVWTPRKHESPRSSIWSLQFAQKIWPKEAIAPPKSHAQPYIAPPPPAPPKKAIQIKENFVSEEELRRIAEEHEEEADRLDSTKPAPSLQVQLGLVLVSKEDYIKKLLKDWDKGKGEFLKGEFRLNLRSLGLQVTAQQSDDLFDSWDDDRGGSLDMKELKRALQLAQRAAQTYQNTPDTREEQAKVRRGLADLAREAAEATSKAVELEKAHRRHVNGLALRPDIQLGQLLYKRQIKPATMVTMWSKPRGKHAGELSKRDFMLFCHSLGLPDNITPDDVVKVFDTYDDDKGGFMDVAEAKAMLKGLLAKAEAEDRVGRRMDQDARHMRLRACRLAENAMAPQDEESNELPNASRLPPDKKGKGGKRKALAVLDDVDPAEEKRVQDKFAEAAKKLNNLGLTKGFNTWQANASAIREKLDLLNGVTRRWMRLAVAERFDSWVAMRDANLKVQLSRVTVWRDFNQQRSSLRLWLQARNQIRRKKHLGELVSRGVMRMGVKPGPRKLLAIVLGAWRQLHWETKMRKAGGVAALCAAVVACLRPKPKLDDAPAAKPAAASADEAPPEAQADENRARPTPSTSNAPISRFYNREEIEA